MMYISQIELPDIYICPNGQFKTENLKRNGYLTRDLLLFGKPRFYLSQISWGDHLHTSFEDMMENILQDVTKKMTKMQGYQSLQK